MIDAFADVAHPPEELIRLLQLTERREPAVVQIAVWVALNIIQGRLRPGQDLNSVDLATRFRSSRTPVREALALLESEGLIEMRARKRPRVASFTGQQVREIFLVRAVIMSSLAEEAVERATDEDIARLVRHVELLRELAAAKDEDRYLWAHYNYFDAIVEISGNGTARAILNSLFLRTLPVRRALARPSRLVESLYFADLTLSAFSRRDPQLTALLVRRSIQAAVDSLGIDPSGVMPIDQEDQREIPGNAEAS